MVTKYAIEKIIKEKEQRLIVVTSTFKKFLPHQTNTKIGKELRVEMNQLVGAIIALKDLIR
jgi:hypothetical protein